MFELSGRYVYVVGWSTLAFPTNNILRQLLVFNFNEMKSCENIVCSAKFNI